MTLIDTLNQIQNQQQLQPQQQPVAQGPNWLKDLIDKRYQPQQERIKRKPIGFNFERDPFDPSSYYKALGSFRDISRAATEVTNQEVANKRAAQAQQAFENSRTAAGAALNGVNARYQDGGRGTAAPNIERTIGLGLQQIGKAYVFGDEGPNTFDCSGLMQWIFGKNGVRLPRTAAEQQRFAAPTKNPVRGDLVFYGYPAYHVGLYLGNGKMLVAPQPGMKVQVQNVYGNPTFGKI